MDILRAKTIDLKNFGKPLSSRQTSNSSLNEAEALAENHNPASFPRRLVFELTNACNLRCKACARNTVSFKPTYFDPEWMKFFDPALPYVEEVTLMGWGEPTVHPHFTDFLSWAAKNDLRKYFCTNGLKLDHLFKNIFDNNCEIIAVSLDGAKAETNNQIRRGSDFNKITRTLKTITAEKTRLNISWPWINFVFTAMKSNLNEFPQMIDLAADLNLNEVKLVYFTAFDDTMLDESLYNETSWVSDVFNQAMEKSEKSGVSLKLPHLQKEDPAGDSPHKKCYTAWRDFFLGSDGFVRPCMSTSKKFFHINDASDFITAWQSQQFVEHRKSVNSFSTTPECENCYQSSFANWNKKESFIQTDFEFAPEWS
ncbi:MAG: radical SAM protein [Deltaproteobacteria bacterium]|jgi:MoaA/NifB/PqqE/SkfB family radical SAM enzyme|nr:radical SAM protein [Deltaproteobacteria bacterium]